MSRQRTRSTSSTRTPGLWDEVERLGDYILDVLGSDSAPTTCSVHWVAHRLAEHMRTAKTAEDSSEREAARDAAALLIAQLWQARGGWPQGWPPDAVQEFTEGVRNATRQHYGDDSSRLPPWLSTLGELEALHWEERATWVNAALLEVGAETLQQALEAAPDAMPEPLDLDNIRWQLQQHGEAETWIAAHAQEGEDPSRRADRAGILGRVLQDIAERRAALVELTLKDARRGQRRKPSLQRSRVGSPGRRGSRRRVGERKS